MRIIAGKELRWNAEEKTYSEHIFNCCQSWTDCVYSAGGQQGEIRFASFAIPWGKM